VINQVSFALIYFILTSLWVACVFDTVGLRFENISTLIVISCVSFYILTTLWVGCAFDLVGLRFENISNLIVISCVSF
jgi:hypothetical protein